MTFEFNHQKYTREQASSLLQQVHQESDQAKVALLAADRTLFLLYHRLASQQGHGTEATGAYMKLFSVSQSADEKISELESLAREVEQLFSASSFAQ